MNKPMNSKRNRLASTMEDNSKVFDIFENLLLLLKWKLLITILEPLNICYPFFVVRLSQNYIE